MGKAFVGDERGQDLVEYTLLLAFICLVSAAAYIGMGESIGVLWRVVNSRLSEAASGS